MVSLCCCSQDFSSCGNHGVLSSLSAQPSHCAGFSRPGAQALVVVAHGLSSCVSWVLHSGSVVVVHGLKSLCSTWDLPRQGWKPCPLNWQANSHPLTTSSVQFSCSVVSDSLWPHGLQHARPPSPSTTPGVYSNSCPLSWWCHPTISSSVVPFFNHPQSFPASGSSQMSQFFASGGESIEVLVSASVLPMNIQEWFPLEWTGWISLQPKGLSRVFSNTTVQKHRFFSAQLSSQSKSHIHTWLLEKPLALTRWTFVGKVMSLLFNMLSRLVITFLSRSKSLLISWLQSPSAVILKPPKIKSITVSTVSPSIC